MIDLHHDLLSIMYYSYIRNDYTYLEKWLKCFRDDNVSGLLANLYFMSREEMLEEMGDREIDVVEMFEKSTAMFKKYLPDEKVIFSIEGCDYIKDTEELEQLYRLGLRNILLVWNNPNKYGSGNRGDYGLTKEGENFLLKAIDLGISIDLSHMNKKTFYDTIELIRKEQSLGKDVKVIASHSNSFNLYNHERNLDDEQIKALKSVGGVLGLVSYSTFVCEGSNLEELREKYLEHINKAVDILGIDNVCVSSDDMTFANNLFGGDYLMLFDYNSINKDLRCLLSRQYSEEDIDKIMYKNIYEKLFKEDL